MTTEPLDRLRATNPLPNGSSAPPVERVLERIRRERSVAGRWRFWAGALSRWTGALVPALGVAVAIAVVVVAVMTLRHGSARTHTPTAPTGSARRIPGSAVPAIPVPAVPAGGMRGLVFVQGVAFPSAADGVISLQECAGCHNGVPTSHAVERDWLATSADGGASWKVERRSLNVFHPRFSGANGWAEGLQAASRLAGIARFYVTHDSGRTWSQAASAAPPLGNQDVSVAAGEVWAIGSACSNPAHCTVTVLHAAVGGSRLAATQAQPIGGDWTNVEVVGAGVKTAYVDNPDRFGDAFVTHDDGRSWQRIAPPCPRGSFARIASDGWSGGAWASCLARHGGTTLTRTTERGRSWKTLPGRFAQIVWLQPVSSRVAWGAPWDGDVLRTTDGGLTWRRVWSAPASLARGMSPAVTQASSPPTLAASSAASATVMTIAARGHVGKQAAFTNLVVYRTTNGGATWTPSVVRLPSG